MNILKNSKLFTEIIMNKKELIFYMCYGFQNAIHNTVRGIAYNYSKSTIRVDVYYDSEPLKDNYDIMSLA